MRDRRCTGLLTAHCENISRYRRILRTYLTAIEREFVERRLREEEYALFELTQGAAQPDCADFSTATEPLHAA